MGAGGSVQSSSAQINKTSAADGGDYVPEYKVRVSSLSELRCPEQFILRLEPEAVVFTMEDSTGEREAFQHFPYYVIMCWGHSKASFQFRLFRQGSQVKTIVVNTKQGLNIEKEIMIVVRRLMDRMEKHGTTKEEFAEFLKILETLSEQEDGPETVQKVLQFCQLHSLTINQAKSIMKRAHAPDPFDRIEVASALKAALINPDSFQMVLHMFDNYDDRLNLCHRLGLPAAMASSETIALREALPKPSSVPPVSPVSQNDPHDDDDDDDDDESSSTSVPQGGQRKSSQIVKVGDKVVSVDSSPGAAEEFEATEEDTTTM